MTKTSGLGDNFYVGGFDLSGNVSGIDQISSPQNALDFTTINLSAHARQGALRDGAMGFTTFMDPAAAHVALKGLPTADVIMSYYRGTALGQPAANLNAKQIGYDPTRAADGSLMLKVAGQGNAFGLEWGTQLTPGVWNPANSLTGQNSGFEGGIGTWVSVSNTLSISSSTDHAHSGSDSLKMTVNGSGGTLGAASSSAAAILTNGTPVVAGQSVYLQAWFIAAATPRNCNVAVNWYDNTGSLLSTSTSSSTADNTSTWTLVTFQTTAPASAAWMRVVTNANSTAAGEIHYVDDVVIRLGPGIHDSGAGSSFGAQAYLQVFGFTGTDATVKIQHSTDGTTWADISGLTFTQITSGTPTAQRLATANTATINRYIQAVAISTAGFTALSFALSYHRNPIAGVVF